MIVETRLSPNRSPRIHGNDAVRLIIVHTPEGGYDGTVKFILTSAARVSYHRLYAKNGVKLTQFVPWEEKAWHAGAMNSVSDGLAIEGHARHFSLSDPGVLHLANGVAERLVARGLRCQWTTDPAKGGFCRHADLQADRTDPTPDLAEWRLFAGMVQIAYERLTAPPKTWPRPIPAWFWDWNIWRLGGKAKPRPTNAPKVIPAWAWRRALAFDRARRK